MMKNSEWGAAAYLSHSSYGINYEIRLNNNSNYITGCGATEENGASVDECEISYGDVSTGIYPQSSTGNITGIFDMSGGAYEYVMGNLSSTAASSGFSTIFPVGKYYDLYSSNVCTLDTCGGDALFESSGWYSDAATFVTSAKPWFRRGGYALDANSAGAFVFNVHDGNPYSGTSWRSVLVVTAANDKYTVSYDANGGTNVPASQIKYAGEDLVLSSTIPSNGSSIFLGWSTSSSSTNVNYTAGSTYTLDESITLYAVWKDTYTINYYLGNASDTAGASLIGTSTCEYGATCTLTDFGNLNAIFPYSEEDYSSTGRNNYGWSFNKWATSTSGIYVGGCANGDSFTRTGNSFSCTTGGTITTTSPSDNINIYAVGKRTLHFFYGIAPTSFSIAFYQYWNPYSTGTYYFGFKDAAGNIGSCSGTVTGTTAYCPTGYIHAGYCANGVNAETYVSPLYYKCSSGQIQLSDSYCFTAN